MIANLQMLGIYENAINDSIAKAEKLINEYGYDVDTLWALVNETLEYTLNGIFYITNHIVGAFFQATKQIIEYDNDNIEIDYFVNGDDSHLYINRNKNALTNEWEEISL